MRSSREYVPRSQYSVINQEKKASYSIRDIYIHVPQAPESLVVEVLALLYPHRPFDEVVREVVAPSTDTSSTDTLLQVHGGTKVPAGARGPSTFSMS